MKPDWKEAPPEANYLAQDENGSWWWWRTLPMQDNGVWLYGEGAVRATDAGKWNKKWRDTLEARPEEIER